MNRYDFYFEQMVTESQMDQSFTWAEEADWLIRQSSILGRTTPTEPRGAVHWGANVTQNASPDLNVLVSAGACTDPTGRHTSWDSQQLVDCSVDYLSAPTAVVSSGNEKYLGLFSLWNRDLTDPTSDGNGLTVYFQQFDSFILRVVQGSEALAGTATPPPTPSDSIRLSNIKLAYGDTQILNSDIVVDLAGYLRDDYVRVNGTNLSNFIYGNPADAIAQLFTYIDQFSDGGSIAFSGTSDWHDASGPLSSSNVQDAINEIVSDLAQDNAGAVGQWGSDKIGSDEYTTAGGYADLTRGSVNDQIRSLADDLDGHIGGNPPEHPASAITASEVAFGAVYVNDMSPFLGWNGTVTNEDSKQAEVVYNVSATDEYLLLKMPAADIPFWGGKGIKKGATYSDPPDATSTFTFFLNKNEPIGSDIQETLDYLIHQLGSKVNANGAVSVIAADIYSSGAYNRFSGTNMMGAVIGGSGRPGSSVQRLTDLQTGSNDVDKEWSMAPYFLKSATNVTDITSMCKMYDDVSGTESVLCVGPGGATSPYIGRWQIVNGLINVSSFQLVDSTQSVLATAEDAFLVTSDENNVYVVVDLDGTSTNLRIYCYDRKLLSYGSVFCNWQTDLTGKNPGATPYENCRLLSHNDHVFLLLGGESCDPASGDTPLMSIRGVDGAIVGTGKGDTTGLIGAGYLSAGGFAIVSDRIYYTIQNGSNGYLIVANHALAAAGESPRQITSTSYPSRDIACIGNLVLCPIDPIGTTATVWIFDYQTSSDTAYSISLTSSIVKPTSTFRLIFDGQLIWLHFVNNDEGGDNEFISSFHPSQLLRGGNTIASLEKYRLNPSATTGTFSEQLGPILYWGGGIWSSGIHGVSEDVRVMTGAGLLAR